MDMAASPVIPAGTAQISRGSEGNGLFMNHRIRERKTDPVKVDTSKIISVDMVLLLNPPMKSAMPQPKQASTDNIMDIYVIFLFISNH
jgi:hypothetical protein